MRRLMIAACLLFLLGSAVLLMFVRYRVDDFDELARVQAGGVTANISFYWQSWSGRVGYALVTGETKLLPEALAGLYLVGILALWSWSCWELGREWGLLTLVVTLIGAPNIAQSLYWQSGATVYALPLALFCLLLVCIKHRAPWPVLVGLAVFITSLSDTVGIGQIVALAALPLIFPAYWRAFGFALIGAVVAFVVVQLAPGNAVRAAYFARPDFWQIPPYALMSAIMPLAFAIWRAPLAVGALILLPLWAKHQKVTRQTIYKALTILAGVLIFDFILMFAAYAATSGPLPERARIVPLFSTLAAIVATLVMVRGITFDT